jgi:hypothetical protein
MKLTHVQLLLLSGASAYGMYDLYADIDNDIAELADAVATDALSTGAAKSTCNTCNETKEDSDSDSDSSSSGSDDEKSERRRGRGNRKNRDWHPSKEQMKEFRPIFEMENERYENLSEDSKVRQFWNRWLDGKEDHTIKKMN